ncbi:hypothetical protein [Streptomyces fructofermentans]|uniref:hypothetical protein n=1 Tax=Streptomyces fructofermentans TaxID=152141 RepID=UPI0037A64150
MRTSCPSGRAVGTATAASGAAVAASARPTARTPAARTPVVTAPTAPAHRWRDGRGLAYGEPV